VIPEYSVVRLEWTVLTVPPPAVRIEFTNGLPTLNWTGLTDVVYNVQTVTNLTPGPWPTVGRVTGTQTNFDFTDPMSKSLRFYRLTVP